MGLNSGNPEISISVNEMTFGIDGGDQDLAVTSTREWKVETDADWVVVSPESGEASDEEQAVVVSVLPNTGMDRTAELKFTIGLKSQYLIVKQTGPEGSADALIVYSNNFDIVKAQSNDGWPYLDSNYNLWDNKKGSGSSTVEYEFGGKMSVRTSGKASNDGSGYSHYSGSGSNKIFFGAATSILKINKITLDGTKVNYTLSFGAQKYLQDGDSNFSFDQFKVYVSSDFQKWTELNAAFPDDADVNGDWNLASVNFTIPEGTTQLGLAFVATESSAYSIDDVLLALGTQAGQTINFADGVEISGTTAGSGSNNGSTDLPEGAGEGTEASPYNAAKAQTLAAALTADETITGVYVTGVVKSIKELDTGTYGNATYYITDADGIANFYVYRGYYLDAAKFTSADQLKVGDEVVIYGDLMNYMGNSPQLAKGNKIVKISGEDEGTEEPEAPGELKVATIAEFLAAPEDNTIYELTGEITRIVTAYSSQYNNISFNIKDATGETSIYRMSCEGVADPSSLTVGDEITVQGKRSSYNEVPQMAQGGKYISHVDKAAPEQEAGTYTLDFANVANRTSWDTSSQIWEQNGIKLTNLKASSTSNVADYSAPARFYKSTSLKIEKAGMKKIIFYCNSGKNTGPADLKSSITDSNATVVVEGMNVTITFANPVDVLEIATLAGQVRVDCLTVYAD